VKLAFYADHNVPRAIVTGLRLRGFDVLTAREDGADQRDDVVVLERSTTLGRLLISEDHDFSGITARWLREGRTFAGVAIIPRQRLSVGQIMDDLELIALVEGPEGTRNQMYYLPLR
jgi:hypothetical protein